MQPPNSDPAARQAASRTPLSGIDILVALKAHFWFLVAAVLLPAILALIFSSSLPNNFTSTATLKFVQEEKFTASDVASWTEAAMRSPPVLDAVLAKFPDFPGKSPEDRRRRLNSKFELTPSPGSQRATATLFYLNLVDSNPDRAKALATALVDTWLEETRPKPDYRARLEGELQRTQTQFDSVSRLIQQYEREAVSLISPNTMQGELASALAKLIEQRENFGKAIYAINEKLRGVSRDTVLQPPTAPVEPKNASTKLAAGLALLGLLTGLGVVIARMLSAHFRNDPVAGPKLISTRWGIFGKLGPKV